MASSTTAGGGTQPLSVTYEGYVGTTMDALIIFEACLQGSLYCVPRRPYHYERETLIRSGAVFVYEECLSGIKRWTDGYNWSPSRILGNFLIYRELEGPFPIGEKKRARKPKKNTPSETAESARAAAAMGATNSQAASLGDGEQSRAESEQSLIGSLIDSYPFKEGGLVKKTISVQWRGAFYRFISYYKPEDVLAKKLLSPSDHLWLSNITPRAELFTKQSFRNLVTALDPIYISHLRSEPGSDYLHPHSGLPMPTAATGSISPPACTPIIPQVMYQPFFLPVSHVPCRAAYTHYEAPKEHYGPPNGRYEAHAGNTLGMSNLTASIPPNIKEWWDVWG
ncbi:hypothetical protein GGTG_13481 [Gaeumannomyces tritici R3-111a-1]|uniref:cAMP-independent regulatory protein pac2 n=1 Tax=Gaeumannomyces tritici (strain R3-111a-1) TaxID=644352 RepID=J3PIZ9_GAET3|nr:hypothetical protein GGTG_13481 [Gaeumannomyces tritici R3-111a-1]EJT68975.1 hypothetical protein GGTG_13481 [Gaeumannomyces tritici R3-111a-1]